MRNKAKKDIQSVEQKRKRTILIALLVYSAIIGPIYACLPEFASRLEILISLPILVMAISWCLIDAREIGYQVGCLMKILLILFFMVGFPIYVFRTRGLSSITTLTKTGLLIIAMTICSLTTGLATLFRISIVVRSRIHLARQTPNSERERLVILKPQCRPTLTLHHRVI